jgi:imidazolonepropionase-like amidohydrolase
MLGYKHRPAPGQSRQWFVVLARLTLRKRREYYSRIMLRPDAVAISRRVRRFAAALPVMLHLPLVLALAMSLSLCASIAAAEDLFITNGRIVPVAGDAFQGSLLVQGGKIAALGPDLSAPPGARVIDMRGGSAIPGMIDAHSHMGVYPWPDVPAHDDGNEATDPITAQVRAMDAIYLEDPAFERALAGGITTVLVIPGSANLIGGEGAVLKLRLGGTLDDMLFPDAPRILKMAFGENPKRVYGGKNKMPSTRMGNAAVLRSTFVEAAEYKRKWADYRGGKKDGDPPERDLQLETLADVIDGKILVQIHCYRKDEMLRLIDIADEFGWKIRAFHHALEAYKVADTLVARGIGVATWPDWWGFKLEAWDAIPQNASIVLRKGGHAALKSDSPNTVQRMNHEAAKMVRYAGLTEREALSLVTSEPAWILGIEDRVGTLEAGKDADIVIFDGDPLSVYSRVSMTIIDGKPEYERVTKQ